MENFIALPEGFDDFEFQGWNDFLRISKDIYTGLVPCFYSTLIPSNEDNTSLRSIVGSFELHALPSNIAQITNTSNDGILCCGGEKWWKDLGATKEEVAEILTRKRSMNVRDIQTFHLLVPVRAVYSIIQYIVLPRNGNIDVMTKVDQMVVFCFINRGRINPVRLILDFLLAAVNAKRRKYATIPYGMFLTKVFIRA